MKNFLIWLRWRLFVSIEYGTCFFIYEEFCDHSVFESYSKFIIKNGAKPFTHPMISARYLKDSHPQTYKQMRRDFMWRFLVKGER